MAKPIFLIYVPLDIGEKEFETYEGLVVHLQDKMSDYHVIGLPKLNAKDFEVKVVSSDNVYEYDILGAKELITNAVKGFTDGNKKLAGEI